MTTNAGARDLSGRKMGFVEAVEGTKATGALDRLFAPEFRNRLDGIIHFNALGTAEIGRVVDKHLAEVTHLLAARDITLEVTDEARRWLAANGVDRAFGARPMARLIERTIRKPLADLLLFDERPDARVVRVAVGQSGLTVGWAAAS